MIGFVTNEAIARQILGAIEKEQTDQGLPFYWTIGSFPILSGPHAGKVFLPADDALLATHLRGPKEGKITPSSSPKFSGLVNSLGGLEARIDLDPHEISRPATAP
jgi:hypothetical protein